MSEVFPTNSETGVTSRWDRATGKARHARRIWELEIDNVLDTSAEWYARDYLILWSQMMRNLVHYHSRFSSSSTYEFIMENA